MGAYTTAKSSGSRSPKRSSSAGDIGLGKILRPSNTTTTGGATSTTSLGENDWDHETSAPQTLQNTPTPTPRLSLDRSSVMTKVAEGTFTEAAPCRTDGPPEQPYHVSSYRRKSLIAQGLAPSFWGPLADAFGRRQILIYTMLLYVAACVGIALSESFPTLMVFRFFQAAGSSSTISIGRQPILQPFMSRAPAITDGVPQNTGAGVIADIALPNERGGYIGTFSGVRQSAMAIGPVLGGVISRVLGFRAIFWFLVIVGSIVTMAILFFLPETLHSIAGNGSIPLTDVRHQALSERVWHKKDNQSDLDDGHSAHDITADTGSRAKVTWHVFFDPFLFLLEKDVACTLYFGAVVYTVWSMVTSSTSFLFKQYFGLDTLQIGLCFIPNGVGCILGSVMAGRQLDTDFKSAEDSYRYRWDLPHCHTLPRQELPRDFPLEWARLAQLPSMIYIFVFGILVYGFSLSPGAQLALPLVAQFVIGYSSTAVLNVNNTLTIDLYPGKSATATAVNNLARCLMGAVGVSLTNVALAKMKPHLLFLTLASITLLSVPTVMAEWKFGMRWRSQRMDRMQRQKDEKGKQRSNV
ncbi:MAG: hypothetical protein Q9170_007977 [Blastenia crenularia]